MIEKLDELAKEVAEFLLEKNYVRIVSHHDADGIASAGVLAHALRREDIPFHISIYPKLTAEVVAEIEAPAVFCDMGSADPSLLESLEEFAVIDHHKPFEEMDAPHINPHLVGIDGAFQLSASCIAYLVARKMGENEDLSGIALAGAIGDKQELEGANREILEEGLKKGVLRVSEGIRIGTGEIEELLFLSNEPYIRGVSGDEKGVKEFLQKLGISGKYEELEEDEIRKLTSAIILMLIDSSREKVLRSLVGEIVWTEREILKDALTLSNVINACGKLDHAGTGVAVCLRDERFLDEALEIHRKYCTKILRELNRAVESIESMSSLKYVWVENEGITGAVAGVLARYVVRDFPVLALRRIDGIVRISARGNEELIERGVDLGDIMRISAQRVGGQGGGHSIAAGASVPEREIAEFLKNVNEEVQKRLAK